MRQQVGGHLGGDVFLAGQDFDLSMGERGCSGARAHGHGLGLFPPRRKSVGVDTFANCSGWNV